jgi:uncharacterized alkaline shock family protein YloU
MFFLTVLVYCVVSLFLGSFLVGVSLNLIDFTQVATYLDKTVLIDSYSRLLIGLWGILIILFCVRYLQSLVVGAYREKAITFSSEHGSVSITLFAIEDMIKKILEEKKELSHIRPKVSLKKRGIEVIIRSNLISEVNIVDFTKNVQEKIKERLYSFLGGDKEINVKFEIRKITFGNKKIVKEEEPEYPFRHY